MGLLLLLLESNNSPGVMPVRVPGLAVEEDKTNDFLFLFLLLMGTSNPGVVLVVVVVVVVRLAAPVGARAS